MFLIQEILRSVGVLAVSANKCRPVELPLKVLHVVMTLSVVRGLSFSEVLQTAQVVELVGKERRGFTQQE